MILNKSTLAEQLYEILRDDIISQRIKPGAKLTLKTLKERFDVSSTPIRDALTRLTEDGLVKYYSNIGINVIELTESDIKELYDFMGDLDSLAITYSSQSPKQESLLRELEQILSLTGSVENAPLSTDEEIKRWIASSDRFHLAFYDYCENSRLKLSAEKLRSQLTICSTRYETEFENQKEIHKMHKEIYNAYKDGNYHEAALLMKKHLLFSYEYALQSFKTNDKELYDIK